MKKRKKKWIIFAVLFLILVVAACYTVFIQPLLEKEEVVYEDGKVFQGAFQVKVVESGALQYTIQDIAYDIDVNVTDEDEDEDEDEEDEEELVQKYLEIEEVYAAAGTPVTAGQPLLKFSESSTQAVRRLLEAALVNAKTDYNEAETEYKLAVLEAESNYELQRINGKYADRIYADQSSQIKYNVTGLEMELQEASEQTQSLREALETAEENYAEAKENYDAIYASYMNDYYITENIPSFTIAQENYRNAKSSFERAESSLEQAQKNLDQNLEQLETLKQDIASAKAMSVISALEAEQSYTEDSMNAEHAEYSLQATLESLAEELQDAGEEQKTLEKKLEAFEALVGQEGIVYATEDGLITEAGYQAGDSLEREGNLFSYATEDTLYITVDVTQEDIVTLTVGDPVEIAFSAYEKSYTGYIENIQTTATSAETPTVSYQVTVHVIGSLDKLFDGMTANISFVTAMKEQALYVERKAIVEENGKEYVYVKEGLTGKVLTEVETGLRNENYVEILSGIEADTTICIPVIE